VTNARLLRSQQGTPSTGDDPRLEELPLWDYACTIYVAENTSFEVTYNETRTIECSMSDEEVRGLGQLRVTAAAGPIPIVHLEDAITVPIEGGYQYRHDDGRSLTLDEIRNSTIRTIVFARLNVFDIESARGSLQGITFTAPVMPSIEITRPIAIGNEEAASITTHLRSFLNGLFGESHSATRPVRIECRYVYSLDGLPVAAPVVLVPRHDFSIDDLGVLEQIESSIQQWLAAAQPPATDARLSFTVIVWSRLTERQEPLLKIADASLAMSAVVI
jgi:hypothetical protein